MRAACDMSMTYDGHLTGRALTERPMRCTWLRGMTTVS